MAMFMKTLPLSVSKHITKASCSSLLFSPSASVWMTGGCRSWYLDARGRNTTLWPGFSFTFRWITRRFDLGAYDSRAREDLL